MSSNQPGTGDDAQPSERSAHGLSRAVVIFAAGLLLLLMGAASWLWLKADNVGSIATVVSGGGSGAIDIGGPFELLDQHGVQRKSDDFLGRYLLVYFGYSYCPDVCPMSLQVMTQALDLLQAETESVDQQVVPIFITVDPERDTVSALKDYAGHFHPRLVALTGEPPEIAAVAKAYRVYYGKAEVDGASDYLMDHSSFYYLMGPDGGYITHFRHDAQPDEMASALAKLLGN